MYDVVILISKGWFYFKYEFLYEWFGKVIMGLKDIDVVLNVRFEVGFEKFIKLLIYKVCKFDKVFGN